MRAQGSQVAKVEAGGGAGSKGVCVLIEKRVCEREKGEKGEGLESKGLADQWSSCKGITSVLQLQAGFHLGSLTNTINSAHTPLHPLPPFRPPSPLSIQATTQTPPPPPGQEERCCRVREQKPGAIKQRSQRSKVKPDGLQRAGRADTGVTRASTPSRWGNPDRGECSTTHTHTRALQNML